MHTIPSHLTASVPPVQCRQIVKWYGSGGARVHALRGVDLTVDAGELLMLVGPSGCGKTTLISVIAGILDHDEGDCLLFGENLSTLSAGARAAFRARHIGFVFQAFNLVPALTAAENVAVPLLIKGVPMAKALRRAAECLDAVDLGDRGKALPGQLSGGQQQRVAVARALVHEPSLIVCDEPTSALDHKNGEHVMYVLKNLASDGSRALVVVTHDARIFPYADRIAYMDDGRVDRIETPAARV